MDTAVHFSSEKQDWKTPPKLLQEILLVFGRDKFCIDPACSDEDVPANKHLIWPAYDGLNTEWLCADDHAGACLAWCNPPYGKEQVDWFLKAVQDFDELFTKTVMLIPFRPDTKLWQDHIFHKHPILALRGRIKFFGAKHPAPFPSALVMIGAEFPACAQRVLGGTLL